MKRIAILGAAHPHVDYLIDEVHRDERPDFQIVAVHDPDPAVATAQAARCGLTPASSTVEALHSSPEIVMVCGIYENRGRDTVAALGAGADVIADKPLCTSLADLDEIERAAAESGHVVSLLLEKRGYPETLAAGEVVASGELGDIVGVCASAPHKLLRPTRPAWFLDNTRYGGILADLSVHDLDLALHFAPATSGRVWGATCAPLAGNPHFKTFGVASLHTPTTLVTSEVSWLTPGSSDVHGEYRLRLVGTRGSADIEWARHRVTVVTDDRPARLLPLPSARRPAQDVLDAFAQGRVPDVSTRESLAASRLALLAQQSADDDSSPREWSI